MEFVIGLAGEMCAGKDTFVAALRKVTENYTLEPLSTSRILQNTLKLWNLPPTRDNLQLLPVVMEQAFGVGSLARAMDGAIANSHYDIVVYDSIRWPADLEVVRKYPSYVIYITAPTKVRWKRLKSRKEKLGEDVISFEQFCENELKPTETHIRELGLGKGDFSIVNDMDLDSFYYRVETTWKHKILPTIEHHMAKKK